MNEVILHHHLGLGDHFICNGLVNALSKQAKIYLICKDIYYETICCLYTDNFNVTVVSLPRDSYFGEFQQVAHVQRVLQKDLIRVGFENIDHTRFDRNFYESISMPFNYRYSMFRLPQVNQKASQLHQDLSNGQQYVLAHRQSSEAKYDINIKTHLPIIDVDFNVTQNMMNWVELIKGASQIHCVPSSFYCLVDSIATSLRGKLFYHNIRKGTLLNPNNEFNNNCWNVISYDTKL